MAVRQPEIFTTVPPQPKEKKPGQLPEHAIKHFFEKIASGGHRTGRVAKHQCCAGDTWYVTLDEEEMQMTLEVDLKKDLVRLPVKYGGMILLSNMIPHRSIPNLSQTIRWSLDLRWQTPDKPTAFYNLNDGVLFRSSKQPDLKIDWDNVLNVRHTDAGQVASSSEQRDDFDTIVTGPWMYKWEITHHNRHTARFLQKKESGQKA